MSNNHTIIFTNFEEEEKHNFIFDILRETQGFRLVGVRLGLGLWSELLYPRSTAGLCDRGTVLLCMLAQNDLAPMRPVAEN